MKKVPSDRDIHFAGKSVYNCDIATEGEDKLRIIQLAMAWRRGAKAMRDKEIKHYKD